MILIGYYSYCYIYCFYKLLSMSMSDYLFASSCLNTSVAILMLATISVAEKTLIIKVKNTFIHLFFEVKQVIF
jgi:hypothetical protein